MKTKFTLMAAALATCLVAAAQWAPVSSGTTQSLYAIDFSGNNGVIAGSNGVILNSTDAGLTWVDSFYWPYATAEAVAFSSPTRVTVGATGRTFISDNSGATFGQPVTVTGFGDFQDIVFTSPTTGIAISDYCRIATTSNAGDTWGVNGNPCNNSSEMRDLSFPTQLVGYYCGANGCVYKTIDGGNNWGPVTAPGLSSTSYYTIQFFDADNGFVAGTHSANQDTFVFKKTTDGGNTWVDMAQPLLAAGVNRTDNIEIFAFANPMYGYIANGSNGKIYKTADGGNSWAVDYNTGGNTNMNKIYIGNGFAIVLGGQGNIWRTNLGNVGINQTAAVEPLQIYPNPATGMLWIKNAEGAEVVITDVAGKIMPVQKQQANQIDISLLPEGFYIVTVTGSGQVRQQKFVVQRK